jgi:hypothetical protein
MWLRWALIVRPIHDALIEDALDRMEVGLDPVAQPRREWSAWVRLLRRCFAASPRPGGAFDERSLRFRSLLGGAAERDDHGA